MASNIMDLMGHVEAGFERGRARQKEQKFNSLASMAYGAKPQERSGYVQQAMGVDPQRALALQGFLSQGDEQKREALGRAATLILDAPDEMRASLWPQIVADLEAQGIAGMKPQWTPEALPMAERIAQAFGGAGSTRGRVQSTFVDARGKRMAVMADGSVRELGDNAPNVQIIDTGEAFYGVNKGNLRADPVQVGGAVQAPQAPQAANGALPPDVVAAAAQRMANAGVPTDEIDAWVAQATGGSLSQGAPAAPQAAPMPTPASGGPLRKAPKSEKPPAGYRWGADGTLAPIPGGPAEVAINARRAAEEARKAAEEAKAEQKRQAAAARQKESVEAATQLVNAIDSLTRSEGFDDLGTMWGDAQIMTPFIRNDAKDAQAQLKNIAGQVALATMARLKALSATGATGFGSLTREELKLLENSIATLQSEEISNEELRRSLKVIRDTMAKVAEWSPSGQQPEPSTGQGQTRRLRFNPATGRIE